MISATREGPWPRRLRAVAGTVVAAILWIQVPSPALAQDIQPVTSAEPAERILLPGRQTHTLRTRVQLVWDQSAGKLRRNRYHLFDPLAAEQLDFFWEPRFPALDRPGHISGEGVLTWREAGSLQHGRETIVAQYRGHVIDGKLHGEGTFLHRSRLRYDGAWVNGLMHGEGHLTLPNGDVYAGGFRDGRLHGHGLYIAATGEIHEGGYAVGARHGHGLVSEANRYAYASYWNAGMEDRQRRASPPADWPKLVQVQANASGPADLAVAVSVEGQAAFCCYVGPPAISYTSISRPDRLEIIPDAPNMLDIWRGEANIALDDAVTFDWDRAGMAEYSFLNYSKMHITPVILLIGLENRGADDAHIVGAHLEVDRSAVDNEPALQALPLWPLENQNIDFSIENYGWGTAENARLEFSFRNPEKDLTSEPMTIEIGHLDSVHDFSFEGPMASLGADIEKIRTLGAGCGWNDEECLRLAINRTAFGDLLPYLRENKLDVGFDVDGHLAYDWLDSDGKRQSDRAPFTTWVAVESFGSRAECEGADIVDIAGLEPFPFQEQATAYRMPLPVSGVVRAGSVSRWRVAVDARKSSLHDFRVVFELADGRAAQSRLIDLLYFRPRSFPESVRPFQPRC
ncbi:MAG: hypothetical protein JJ913_02115 [Rhizobiaceae bacterium]|nr:hypothetical protein [Rhizobiaceae bacterium]